MACQFRTRRCLTLRSCADGPPARPNDRHRSRAPLSSNVRPVLKSLASCLLATLLAGCVGAVALHPESVTQAPPFQPNRPYTDSTGKLRSANTPTREAVLREWGEPADREVKAGTETWLYNRGRDWCGVVLGLIVPIPLVLPVCSTEDRIVVQGESAVSITTVRTTESGKMCGLFVNGFHGGPDWCTK
jgi:hypothetical protein